MENCMSAGFESPHCFPGGEGVESYSSPYGRIMSGFVSVGEAGSDGNAMVVVVVVVVVVAVCMCMLAAARIGKRVAL